MAACFIGNIKSKTYHRPACFNLPQAQYKTQFNSRADAETAGYKPCGMCRSNKGQGGENMIKTHTAAAEVAEQTTKQTITLAFRCALWRDSSTGGGMSGYIPAGTYPVAEVRDGFARIDGRGWVHCIPEALQDA